MTAALERVVAEAVASVGVRSAVELDARWRDLGIDSLDLLEVVLRVERTLGCSIPDEAAVRLFTPRDLVVALALLQPAPSAVPIDPREPTAIPIGSGAAARVPPSEGG